MNYAEESLKKHYEWKGKLETVPKMKIETKDDLSLAYTPGVAQACLEIQKDPEKSFLLTGRGNLVAVITDGTAVLGLGDIGPEAGMPVMEGKCVLFKSFGGVDAIPLCVKSKDPDEIVNTVALLEGSFGGINLEDIAAPRCFEIERKLKERLSIPVFHDDQHGTAVVVLAAVLNALRLVKKDIGEIHAEKKSTVIIVSHNMEDISRVCGKVLVMRKAQVEMFAPVNEVFEHSAELCSMGLNVPQITRVFISLKEKGFDVPSSVYTPAQACSAVIKAIGGDGT